MAEWWVNNSGQNLLTGIPGDATNPAHLDDETIAAFFSRYPAAVASYTKLRTGLTDEERARLDPLLEMAQALTSTDPHTFSDAVQSKWNKAGVRTAGRYGGTRRGGNR